MDFGFSQEQGSRPTARKFSREGASGFVRARMEEPAGVTDEFWGKLAEQGWLGLIYPEEHGGSGLGFVDLTVLMEEMGRVVMPGPFFSTVLLGGLAIREAGSAAQKKEWLTKIAAGQAKATLAWTEPSARWDAAGVTCTAKEQKGGFVLNGTKLFVPDAHLADAIVVVARTGEGKAEDGVSLILVPKTTRGVQVKLLPTMDQTRKLCEITFQDATVPADALMGVKGKAWPTLTRVVERATVALCAEMCGGAQRVLDMTTDYAKIRIAFGKPIGTYQGVVHKVSGTCSSTSRTRSHHVLRQAGGRRNSPEARWRRRYKAYAMTRTARSPAPIQLHGGIGFTWSTTCTLSSAPVVRVHVRRRDVSSRAVAQLINL
jgi:alkylation response protein AidB-like acyl-CoA dehydrogenase